MKKNKKEIFNSKVKDPKVKEEKSTMKEEIPILSFVALIVFFGLLFYWGAIPYYAASQDLEIIDERDSVTVSPQLQSFIIIKGDTLEWATFDKAMLYLDCFYERSLINDLPKDEILKKKDSVLNSVGLTLRQFKAMASLSKLKY